MTQIDTNISLSLLPMKCKRKIERRLYRFLSLNGKPIEQCKIYVCYLFKSVISKTALIQVQWIAPYRVRNSFRGT